MVETNERCVVRWLRGGIVNRLNILLLDCSIDLSWPSSVLDMGNKCRTILLNSEGWVL